MNTPPQLLLASRNSHKIEELRRILRETGLHVELLDLSSFPEAPDVAETGSTFEENALIKGRAAAVVSGLPAVADDSGLCVDALSGMPGIFSARWSGRHGDDQANLDLLLNQITDVPDDRRGAQFVCVAALVTPGGVEHTVQGQVDGSIIRERRGKDGFGYDPIFVPVEDTRTTAEMTPAEKDAISHRGRALRRLAPFICELLRQ